MNAMKNIFLLGLLGLISLYSSCSQCINLPNHFDQEGKIEVCLFTELIFKRFYYIVRLEAPIFLITTLNTKKTAPVNLEFVTDIDSSIIFKHQHIQDSIDKMKKTKSLVPILTLWEDFNTYKFLNDETFLDDFTKLILIISKKLVLYIISQQERSLSFLNSVYSFFENGLSASVNERLEYIDMLIIEFVTMKNNKRYIKLPIVKLDHVVTNFTEAVSDRMYYIKRLQNALDTLLHIKCAKTMFFNYIDSSRVIFDPVSHFHHERINECIELMELEKNSEPMFLLWNEFTHYQHLNDELFLEELIKLVFISYKNLAVNNESKQEKAFQRTLQELLQFYEKLDSIPLEEILNAIDLLAHELPKISEQYELNTDISWREWLRKYWWSPPLIIGAIAIKALVIYQYIKLKKAAIENPQENPA